MDINTVLAKSEWDKAYNDLEILEQGKRNYFILDEAKEDKLLAWADGNLESGETGALLSGYIPVMPNELIQFSYTTSQVFYFDKDKRWINVGKNMSAYKSLTIDNIDSIRFIRVVFRSNFLNGRSKYEVEVKVEKGVNKSPWTPSPEDIGAHPFVADVADASYRNKVNREEIKVLSNAVTALGGSV